MIVTTVFFQVMLMCAMMFTGYLLTKSGFMKQDHVAFITKLLMNLLIPCLVLSAAAQDMGDITAQGVLFIAAVVLFIMVLFTVLGRILAFFLKADEDAALVISRCIGYPNNGFIGMPLAAALYGGQGTVWCAISMFGGNIYLFSLVMQSLRRDKGGDIKQQLKGFLTPLNFSTVGLILMMLIGLKMPSFLYSYCNFFGSCTCPMAMLVVGSLLASGPLLDTIKTPSLYVITFMRNIVSPLTAALIFRLLGWDTDISMCMVLMLGTSAASTVSIIAARYDRRPILASQILLHTNLFLPLTLPMIAAICSKFL